MSTSGISQSADFNLQHTAVRPCIISRLEFSATGPQQTQVPLYSLRKPQTILNNESVVNTTTFVIKQSFFL